MIKIVRLPVGFSIAYKKEVSASWVPVVINDLKLSEAIIEEVTVAMNGVIEENKIEITHFEFYSLINIKFFKGNHPCYCRGPDVHVLTGNAKIIKEKLDKLSELL